MWLSNPQDPESEFEIYRFKVVPFGSASSPFTLKATLHFHLKSQNSDTADNMLKNLYVDNLISGGTTEENVIQYFREARDISKENFNLMSWASNSPEQQIIVQKENFADACQVVNLLGLHWNTSSDKVSFITK